jgi:hypothetical protein
MRVPRLVLGAAIVTLVVTAACAARSSRGEVVTHDADAPGTSGSADHWPPIPRRPGA